MNLFAISLILLLFAYADVPQVNSLRPRVNSREVFPSGGEIPLFGNDALPATDPQGQTAAQD
jgi:hypothetical protein